MRVVSSVGTGVGDLDVYLFPRVCLVVCAHGWRLCCSAETVVCGVHGLMCAHIYIIYVRV